jgi:hypothetical protein
VTLSGLRAALVAQGGTAAEMLTPVAGDDDAGLAAAAPGPPQLAARGPRVAGREGEYELLLEMILEGSLLHYGVPRLVRPVDPDLALLLGDQLYALGLSRLAQLGDLDAVAELADLISLLAQAQAAGDPALAAAVWDAGAAAIGWGGSAEYEAAKALARAGDDRARDALITFRDATVPRSEEGGK